MNSVLIEEDRKNLAIALFKSDCLLFGSFKLSSGVTINAFLDLIMLFSYPKILNQICDFASCIVKNNNLNIHNVCGVSYAGIPFAALVADRLQVPLLMRNKELSLSPQHQRIVGDVKKKNEVVVVEEVMCSATSTLQTIKDIEDAGLVVKHVLVMVDLEQGGRSNLAEMGYQLHSVLKLSELATVLYTAGLINDDRIEDIRLGWKESFAPNGDCITSTILEDRQSLRYERRVKDLKSKIAKRLFEIIVRKRSNLCVILTSNDFEQILKMADQIGDHICILGVHLELLDSSRIHELKRIAQNRDFLLMDDRKLSEDGEILEALLKKILSFVDLVTVFPMAGQETLITINDVTQSMSDKGVIIVGSCFTQDSLIKSSFERNIINLTLTHYPSITGFISHQNSDIPLPYVHIMQDMKTTTSTTNCDDLYSYYSEDIITQKLAADVVMVTVNCDVNTVNLVKRKQQSSWFGYENRFCNNNNNNNNNNGNDNEKQ